MNKSIDGTADDEEEGVPTDEAIRAGLELLKVDRRSELLLLFLSHGGDNRDSRGLFQHLLLCDDG